MNNIYDIFNSRKESSYSLYEDIEASLESLNNIVNDSTNEMIELQSAMYLEDLVLENMMYDNFNEEELSVTLEATVHERIYRFKEFVKRQWKRLQEWFLSVVKSIEGFFSSGEKFVNQYRDIIPQAIRSCKSSVVVNQYNNHLQATSKCTQLASDIIEMGKKASNKDEVLNKLRIKDKKDIQGLVRKFYMSTEEPVKTKISKINPETAMHYAGNKKILIDSINKTKREFSNYINDTLSQLERADNVPPEGLQTFNFSSNLAMAALNAEIGFTRKAAQEHIIIIKKAVSLYKEK